MTYFLLSRSIPEIQPVAEVLSSHRNNLFVSFVEIFSACVAMDVKIGLSSLELIDPFAFVLFAKERERESSGGGLKGVGWGERERRGGGGIGCRLLT